MLATPEFNDLFTNWMRKLFREIATREDLDVDEDTYIYLLFFQSQDSDLHCTFYCNRDAIVENADLDRIGLCHLRIAGWIKNAQLIETFHRSGLSHVFDALLVAELDYEHWSDNGVPQVTIYPYVNIFNAPIVPIFFNLQREKIETLTKDVEDAISPMLSWSIMVDAHSQPE